MIGDLLASITGEKPAPSSSTPSKPASVPKRKADYELPGSAAKTPRTTPVATGVARKEPSTSVSVPRIAESRLADRSVRTSSSVSKPVPTSRPVGDRSGSSVIAKRPQSVPPRQGPTSSSTTSGRNATTGSSARPVDSGPKPEPKKKSFAEIMARAKAAQQSLPQTLGKIQHKTIDSGMTKRERDQAKLSEARKAAKLAKQGGVVRPRGPGTASRNRTDDPPPSVKETNGKAKKSAAPAEEVKKVKKAALATTGYAGTARPRPGAATSKPNGALSRVGSEAATRPRERSRYGGALSGPRRRYDEEEDEDLDDFIEYDDEEEEPGYGYGGARRGGYDSLDDESDMEAGLTDVEEEERRAERVARLEDKKEEELEKRLKREKEERRQLQMGRR